MPDSYPRERQKESAEPAVLITTPLGILGRTVSKTIKGKITRGTGMHRSLHQHHRSTSSRGYEQRYSVLRCVAVGMQSARTGSRTSLPNPQRTYQVHSRVFVACSDLRSRTVAVDTIIAQTCDVLRSAIPLSALNARQRPIPVLSKRPKI